MDIKLNLSKEIKQITSAFLLIILPWIVLLLGAVFGVEFLWYYLLSIMWFGMGFIFFAALN